MDKLIILNHKMTLNYNELDNYITSINKLNYNLIIAPSNIYLIPFVNKCKHKIASQDICYLENGNNTGKVSANQIKSLNIKYSIVGHNEKDTDLEKINLKLKKCLNNNITPILCISENDRNITTINTVLEILLKDIDDISNIIFAYEPVYLIDKDETINIKDITMRINHIYDWLYNRYRIVPFIVYGGSVRNNIKEMLEIKNIKGVMIGKISSNIKEITKILSNI